MASVIIMGLGKMGSAFARRLVQTNNSVCVWNRSEEKMKEIVGAIPASSPEAALTENQNALIVTFFSTDVVTRNVLFTPTVAPLLRGRALLNLASGNPDDGRSMHKELGTHGLTCYLDGAYCGPPVTIERGTGTLFLSATEESMLAPYRDMLSNCGKVVFAGGIGASKALDYAVVDFAIFNMFCMCNGLAMLDKEGVSSDVYVEALKGRLAAFPDQVKNIYLPRMAERSDESYATNPTADLRTMHNFFNSRMPYLEANNLPTDMTKYILNTFESVGGGPDGPNQGNDWTRIQEVMRFPKQHVPK
eukprot:NODE_4585_length_1043_cov_134.704348_g4382_i0.p1 GENE.NODE_4585_length_1043_cov_134.704348_g4382_i0~~NODE_4585_length_1043_cov_134.704348_g4382_i0.p1  ORF type:complete len:304 (+),score=54.28 NODE_4585_length_1043_cov_134.704348_g4382_i0:63-974(+)